MAVESFGYVLERRSSGARPGVLEARKEGSTTVSSIHPLEFVCRPLQHLDRATQADR
jgi:hypothetical protein